MSEDIVEENVNLEGFDDASLKEDKKSKKVVKKVKDKPVGNSIRVEYDSKTDRDELVDFIAETLNKETKEKGKVAFTLDKEEDPSQVRDWISTGVVDLDINISNIRNGGIPCGRITEISGLEGSGKTLLISHIIAETQRKGGIAVLLDTESSVLNEFLKAIGVDIKKLLYIPCETIEETFEHAESIITKIRTSKDEKNRNRLITIVVDSIAGATTKDEALKDYDNDGFNTSKSKILGKSMRKLNQMIADQKIAFIMTNQLRTNMGGMFGEQYTTTGGKAVGFHSSVRLRLKTIGRIKKTINGKDVTIGVNTECTTTKNRLAPPFKKSVFKIFYDSGIDTYSNWIDILSENNIITPAKKDDLKLAKIEDGSFEYKLESKKSDKSNNKDDKKEKPKSFTFIDSAEKVHIIDKNLPILLKNNPDLKAELYEKIYLSLYSKYKTPDMSIQEDIDISDSED